MPGLCEVAICSISFSFVEQLPEVVPLVCGDRLCLLLGDGQGGVGEGFVKGAVGLGEGVQVSFDGALVATRQRSCEGIWEPELFEVVEIGLHQREEQREPCFFQVGGLQELLSDVGEGHGVIGGEDGGGVVDGAIDASQGEGASTEGAGDLFAVALGVVAGALGAHEDVAKGGLGIGPLGASDGLKWMDAPGLAALLL